MKKIIVLFLSTAVNWIVSPWNPYVESLTASVTVFGDRAYKEAIKVK